MLNILAADSPIWPSIVVSIIGGVFALAGVLFTVFTQRKIKKTEVLEARKNQEDNIAKTNIAAQVDLTKDVLENWKDIVKSLGQQIVELHAQVEGLEQRERKCQIELLTQRARLLELEARVAEKGGPS